MPLTWMAVCAASDNKKRVELLLNKLQPHYRIDPNLMKRLIQFKWSDLATADAETWEKLMKNTKTYVPVF